MDIEIIIKDKEEQVIFRGTAVSIDDAIAELGRAERYLNEISGVPEYPEIEI